MIEYKASPTAVVRLTSGGRTFVLEVESEAGNALKLAAIPGTQQMTSDELEAVEAIEFLDGLGRVARRMVFRSPA